MKKQLRMTNQRRIILEELCKVTSHPTADEIYQIVRKRLPRISLGTVYRNLDTLSSQGMALKLELGGTQSHFDGNVAPHYHVRCNFCDRVADLKLPVLQKIEKKAQEFTDYQIDYHNLEFVGLCSKCKD
jgi:Fur family transcriptional regulator, ferric uptake regulator